MYSNSIGSSQSHESLSYQYRYRSESSSVSQKTQSERSESPKEAEQTSSRADNFDVSKVVDTVWNFTSSRVAEAQANGASEDEINALWDSALSGVEKGFGEARDILDSMGVLDDELAMKIDSAFGQLVDKIDQQKLGVEEVSVDEVAKDELLNGLQVNGVQVEPAESRDVSEVGRVDRSITTYQLNQQSFELDLKTVEGDKIRIRSYAEEEFGRYGASDGYVSSTVWTENKSSSYSLVIEGDLNDQERADLDALLEQVNTLANEFYSGNLDTAFDMASEIGIDGTSLKSMNLSLKEVEKTGVAAFAGNSPYEISMPKGLEPLKQYADELISAQSSWQDRFESRSGLIESLANHPANNGMLQKFANQLLG